MRCFVCGAAWTDAPQCDGCGNPSQVQERLMGNAARRRFLFGRAKQSTPDPAEAPRSRPKPKPKPKMARPIYEQVARQEPPPAIDLIAARDPEIHPEPQVAVPRTPPAPPRLRTLSYLVDVAGCMLLNGWVFLCILMFSGRGARPLVDFSMVPLTFVLLSFTGLYFGLFRMIFAKSLGRLLLEYLAITHEDASGT